MAISVLTQELQLKVTTPNLEAVTTNLQNTIKKLQGRTINGNLFGNTRELTKRLGGEVVKLEQLFKSLGINGKGVDTLIRGLNKSVRVLRVSTRGSEEAAVVLGEAFQAIAAAKQQVNAATKIGAATEAAANKQTIQQIATITKLIKDNNALKNKAIVEGAGKKEVDLIQANTKQLYKLRKAYKDLQATEIVTTADLENFKVVLADLGGKFINTKLGVDHMRKSVKASVSTLKEHTAIAKKANDVLNKTGIITDTAAASTFKYDKIMKNFERTISSFSARATEKSIRDARKELDRLNKVYIRFDNALTKSNMRLKEAATQLKNAGTDTKKLAEAEAKYNKELAINNRLTSKQKISMAAANEAIAKQRTLLTKVSAVKWATNIAKRAAMYIGLYQAMGMVTGAMRSEVEYLVEMDKTSRMLAAVADIRGNYNDKLRQGQAIEADLVDISRKYGAALSEVNKAALELVRAGTPTDKINDATKATILLAKVTGDTIAASASAVITYTQVFGTLAEVLGKTSYDVNTLGDKLAYMANESRMSTKDIGTFANYALATATNVGLSIDAVNALGISFNNMGFNASTAGTQVRKFANLLHSSNKKVEYFFRSVGISQQKLAEAIAKGGEESNKAFVDMLNRFSQMTDEAFLQATAGLQIRAKNALLAMRAGASDIIAKLKGSVQDANGELEKAMITTESYEASWERLKGTMQLFMKGTFEPIMDKFRELSLYLATTGEDISSWGKAFTEVAGKATSFVGTLTVALKIAENFGKILAGVGGMITGNLLIGFLSLGGVIASVFAIDKIAEFLSELTKTQKALDDLVKKKEALGQSMYVSVKLDDFRDRFAEIVRILDVLDSKHIKVSTTSIKSYKKEILDLFNDINNVRVKQGLKPFSLSTFIDTLNIPKDKMGTWVKTLLTELGLQVDTSKDKISVTKLFNFDDLIGAEADVKRIAKAYNNIANTILLGEYTSKDEFKTRLEKLKSSVVNGLTSLQNWISSQPGLSDKDKGILNKLLGSISPEDLSSVRNITRTLNELSPKIEKVGFKDATKFFHIFIDAAMASVKGVKKVGDSIQDVKDKLSKTLDISDGLKSWKMLHEVTKKDLKEINKIQKDIDKDTKKRVANIQKAVTLREQQLAYSISERTNTFDTNKLLAERDLLTHKYTKSIEHLKSLQNAYNEARAKQKDDEETLKDLKAEQLALQKDYNKIKAIDGDTTKIEQKQQENINKQKKLQLTIEGDINAKLSAQKNLNAENTRLHGTISDGINAQILAYQDTLPTAYEQGIDIMKTAQQSLDDAWADFFDKTNDSFLDMGDLAKKVLNDIADQMLKTQVIQPLTSTTSSLLGSVTGSLFDSLFDGWADGGYTAGMPSDKTPVGVVHANEYVIPANMVRTHPALVAGLEAERRGLRPFWSGGSASDDATSSGFGGTGNADSMGGIGNAAGSDGGNGWGNDITQTTVNNYNSPIPPASITVVNLDPNSPKTFADFDAWGNPLNADGTAKTGQYVDIGNSLAKFGGTVLGALLGGLTHSPIGAKLGGVAGSKLGDKLAGHTSFGFSYGAPEDLNSFMASHFSGTQHAIEKANRGFADTPNPDNGDHDGYDRLITNLTNATQEQIDEVTETLLNGYKSDVITNTQDLWQSMIGVIPTLKTDATEDWTTLFNNYVTKGNEALLKVALDGSMFDTPDFYSIWEEYAKSLDQEVTQALKDKLTQLTNTRRDFDLFTFDYSDDSLGALEYTMNYLKDDLDKLEEAYGVADLTLENFNTLMNESLAEDFTPENINKWSQLEEATKAYFEAQKQYTSVVNNNVFAFFDMFKSSAWLLADKANAVGADVAHTYGELYKSMQSLAEDGLNSKELAFLKDNKEQIDDYVAELTTTFTSLEGNLSTIGTAISSVNKSISHYTVGTPTFSNVNSSIASGVDTKNYNDIVSMINEAYNTEVQNIQEKYALEEDLLNKQLGAVKNLQDFTNRLKDTYSLDITRYESSGVRLDKALQEFKAELSVGNDVTDLIEAIKTYTKDYLSYSKLTASSDAEYNFAVATAQNKIKDVTVDEFTNKDMTEVLEGKLGWLATTETNAINSLGYLATAELIKVRNALEVQAVQTSQEMASITTGIAEIVGTDDSRVIDLQDRIAGDVLNITDILSNAPMITLDDTTTGLLDNTGIIDTLTSTTDMSVEALFGVTDSLNVWMNMFDASSTDLNEIMTRGLTSVDDVLNTQLHDTFSQYATFEDTLVGLNDTFTNSFTADIDATTALATIIENSGINTISAITDSNSVVADSVVDSNNILADVIADSNNILVDVIADSNNILADSVVDSNIATAEVLNSIDTTLINSSVSTVNTILDTNAVLLNTLTTTNDTTVTTLADTTTATLNMLSDNNDTTINTLADTNATTLNMLSDNNDETLHILGRVNSSVIVGFNTLLTAIWHYYTGVHSVISNTRDVITRELFKGASAVTLMLRGINDRTADASVSYVSAVSNLKDTLVATLLDTSDALIDAIYDANPINAAVSNFYDGALNKSYDKEGFDYWRANVAVNTDLLYGAMSEAALSLGVQPNTSWVDLFSAPIDNTSTSNDALVQELKGLASDMKDLLYSISTNTKKTADNTTISRVVA